MLSWNIGTVCLRHPPFDKHIKYLYKQPSHSTILGAGRGISRWGQWRGVDGSDAETECDVHLLLHWKQKQQGVPRNALGEAKHKYVGTVNWLIGNREVHAQSTRRSRESGSLSSPDSKSVSVKPCWDCTSLHDKHCVYCCREKFIFSAHSAQRRRGWGQF